MPRSRWTQLESRVNANTERLLEMFESTGVQATFFVLGWVAERCPHLVQRIAALGHEVASHGFGHRLVYDQTPDEFREDVRRSKHVLEAIAGVRPRLPRTELLVTPRRAGADILIEEGFRHDASTPVHHDRTASRSRRVTYALSVTAARCGKRRRRCAAAT